MALEAPLLTRMRVIKVLAETDKGTKVAGTQAIQVMEPSIDWEASYEPRGDLGLYRGNSQAGVIIGMKGICPFEAELRGDGSQGLEAGLIPLLQTCGFKQTVEVYQVHSGHTDDKTLSLDFWQAGDKKGLAGASGNVVFGGQVGERLMCKFDFAGIWQAPTTDALPAFAPSTTPPMILQSGTFTFATESIKIASFELDMGNKVVPWPDADAAGGVAYYLIANNRPTLKLMMSADTVAGFDYYGRQLAGTAAAVSLALDDGTDKITFTIPAVISEQLTEADKDGIKMYDFVGECLHSSGNDSVAIAVTAA